MKHELLYAFAAAALLTSAVSCRQEEFFPEPNGVELTFFATHEEDPATRTVLGEGGSVLWSPSDEVSIFCGNGSGWEGYSSSPDNSLRVSFLRSIACHA